MYLIDKKNWKGSKLTVPTADISELSLMGNVEENDKISIPDGEYIVPEGKVLIVPERGYCEAYGPGQELIKFTNRFDGIEFPHVIKC
jgi:hypothetical protein